MKSSLFKAQTRGLLFGGVILMAAALPLSVKAQPYEVIAGEDFSLPAVGPGTVVTFLTAPGRCYCCSIIGNGSTGGYISQIDAHGLNYVYRGTTEPYSRNGSSDEPQKTRVCFNNTTLLTTSILLTLGLDDGALSVSDFKVRCDETTLFGGFNTSVTDFNFLEISTTVSDWAILPWRITGRISAWNVVSNPDTQVLSDHPFTLDLETGSDNRRVDINIHEAAGSGAFGPIHICHDAPPGAIKAVLSQYNITSMSPLEFEPVAQEVFKSRGELAGR